MSITAEVLEIVREMPGCTSAEVVALMSHVKKQTVYARLDALNIRGEVRQERDDKKRVHWYINETGVPVAPRRGKAKKPAVIELNVVTSKEHAERISRHIRDAKVNTTYVPEVAHAHYQATIDQLRARVAELEAWKADAIQRYPDLAVPPLLKKARDIVAAELRASDDINQAERVELGHCDTTLPVRVALKMLEGDV